MAKSNAGYEFVGKVVVTVALLGVSAWIMRKAGKTLQAEVEAIDEEFLRNIRNYRP